MEEEGGLARVTSLGGQAGLPLVPRLQNIPSPVTHEEKDTLSIKVVSTCFLQRAAFLLTRFKGEKCRIVKSIGFGGLLWLGHREKVDAHFSLWVLRNMDTDSMSLHTPRSNVMQIKDVDVHRVLGIPYGGAEVKDNSNVLGGVMKEIRGKLFIGQSVVAITSEHLERILVKEYGDAMSEEEVEAFKIAFVLYSLTYILAVRGYSAQIPLGLVNYVVDTSQIPRVNWAGYVLDVIRQSAIRVKELISLGKKEIVISGCMLFLEIFYIDNLDVGLDRSKPTLLPRVGSYDEQTLASLIAKDRRAKDDGKFSCYGANKVLYKDEVCYSRSLEKLERNNKRVIDILERNTSDFEEVARALAESSRKEIMKDIYALVGKRHNELIDEMIGALHRTQDGAKGTLLGNDCVLQKGAECNLRKRINPSSVAHKKRICTNKYRRSSRFSTEIYQCEFASDGVVIDCNVDMPAITTAPRNEGQCIAVRHGYPFHELRRRLNRNTNVLGAYSEGTSWALVPFTVADNANPVRRDESMSLVPYNAEFAHSMCAKKVYEYMDCPESPFYAGYTQIMPERRESTALYKCIRSGQGAEFERIWFEHNVPSNIKITGEELQLQFNLGGVFSVPLCDALVRLYTELDAMMYGDDRKHWRCYLPASFSCSVLNGEDYLESKLIRDSFIGEGLHFDFEHCRKVIAPVYYCNKWSCYVWDLTAMDLCVLDPLFMNTSEEKAENYHESPMMVLTEALVNCVSRFFRGWSLPGVPWFETARIDLTGRCRWNNSGVYTMHYARWYAGHHLERRICDVDLADIRADMLFQLLKMTANVGELPTMLTEA